MLHQDFRSTFWDWAYASHDKQSVTPGIFGSAKLLGHSVNYFMIYILNFKINFIFIKIN